MILSAEGWKHGFCLCEVTLQIINLVNVAVDLKHATGAAPLSLRYLMIPLII